VFAETLLKVKARRGEAVAALLGQLDDVEIAVWVVAALAKAGAVEAVPRIRAHADSPTTLLRNEARKAIRKLERVSGSAPSAPAPQSTRRESESTATIAKTSRNCDLERLHGILLRLPAVLEGVQAGEVQRVLSTIEAMEPDDEQVFTLTASWQGVPERVTLDVFMDDVDAPDVTFGARPEIIRLIDELFSA
jgi:hypothetical protein